MYRRDQRYENVPTWLLEKCQGSLEVVTLRNSLLGMGIASAQLREASHVLTAIFRERGDHEEPW